MKGFKVGFTFFGAMVVCKLIDAMTDWNKDRCDAKVKMASVGNKKEKSTNKSTDKPATKKVVTSKKTSK